MEEHAEKLAQLETKNVGKPISLSRGDAVQHRQHPLLRGGVPGDGRQGYGKDMSMYSIKEYTVVKHVMARLD